MALLALSRFATIDSCFLLLAGIILFSGSLYVMALTNLRRLGAITPLDGLCFLAGWPGWSSRRRDKITVEAAVPAAFFLILQATRLPLQPLRTLASTVACLRV